MFRGMKIFPLHFSAILHFLHSKSCVFHGFQKIVFVQKNHYSLIWSPVFFSFTKPHFSMSSDESSDLFDMSISASQRGPPGDQAVYEDDFHEDEEEQSIAAKWAAEPSQSSVTVTARPVSSAGSRVPRMEVNRLLQERLEKMKSSALRRAHELPPPPTRNAPFVIDFPPYLTLQQAHQSKDI